MKLRLIGKFIAMLVHPRSQLNYGSLTTCMVDQMGTLDDLAILLFGNSESNHFLLLELSFKF